MKDLFDQLSKTTNLMISDFRDEKNKEILIQGMKLLKCCGYEIAEWNKLLRYICKEETTHFQTIEDIIMHVKNYE